MKNQTVDVHYIICSTFNIMVHKIISEENIFDHCIALHCTQPKITILTIYYLPDLFLIHAFCMFSINATKIVYRKKSRGKEKSQNLTQCSIGMRYISYNMQKPTHFGSTKMEFSFFLKNEIKVQVDCISI